jgi:hypothetical protein
VVRVGDSGLSLRAEVVGGSAPQRCSGGGGGQDRVDTVQWSSSSSWLDARRVGIRRWWRRLVKKGDGEILGFQGVTGAGFFIGDELGLESLDSRSILSWVWSSNRRCSLGFTKGILDTVLVLNLAPRVETDSVMTASEFSAHRAALTWGGHGVGMAWWTVMPTWAGENIGPGDSANGSMLGRARLRSGRPS